MRIIALALTFLTCFLPRLAAANDLEQFQIEYTTGSSRVSLYGYHIKITAEQRSSDNLAQVVILPNEEGVQFTIQQVDFTVIPPGGDVAGPVANVQGVFTIQYSTGAPITVVKTIPVQLSIVDTFTISQDEATVEGIQVYRKQLPSLLQAS
jgi:hypothetical protein